MTALHDSLLPWIQTFKVTVPHSTVKDLLDGVALAQILHQIDPEYFNASWLSKIKTDVTGNWRLRVSNTRKIVQGVLDYYGESLCLNILNFPDLDPQLISGEHPNVTEMGRLLQLILGAAVNSPRREDFVGVIMGLEEEVQHAVMKAIQQLEFSEMPPGSYIAGNAGTADTFPTTPTRTPSKFAVDLNDISVELNAALEAKEKLAQRCHELDMQVGYLMEEKQSLSQEVEQLHRRISDMENAQDPASLAHRSAQQTQQKIDALQAEVYKLETSRDEYKTKLEFHQHKLRELERKNEQLEHVAEEARVLRDELDVLRHTSDKVNQYETSLETARKRLEEMSDLKKQLRLLEEKNTTYMQQNLELEEEARRIGPVRSQMEVYKKQVHELHARISEETRRADKAEFERGKWSDKYAACQTEKERLISERDSLKETLEEMRNVQLQKESSKMGLAGGVGTESSSEMLEALPPEIKEKLLRLQHENKMLKLNQSNTSVEEVTMLKTLLEEAQTRQNDLEIELRQADQRNIALESELKDLMESHKSISSKGATSTSSSSKNEEELVAKLKSAEKQIADLKGVISAQEQEINRAEQRYQQLIQKAKNVKKSLDSSLDSDATSLRLEINDKNSYISRLKQEISNTRNHYESQERLLMTALQNYGTQQQRRAADERMQQALSGQSFLSRQRQPTAKRHNITGVHASDYFE